ncbi:protein-arginine deiminase family protein [Sorangium sp. So ce233]|uniref:protein-arginine deiminase family protein n=1 Tax=Sorangium sp. So ce233 TaxID=3133290 RepID=UPI003F613A0E
MHLDADRDGAVDDDRSGLDTWEWGAGRKGAIVLCNNDDDEGASASDNSDRKVNGGNDDTEIAPLVIRRTGGTPPAGWRASLEVSTLDKARIRIFDGRSSGAAEIIGPTKGSRFDFPDLNFVEKEFGMEAVQYADENFSGEVTITFTLTKGGAGSLVEVAKVRVAPWLMPNHLDAATKVFVVEASVVHTPTGPSDNARFRRELGAHVAAAGCTLQAFASNDVWMQDCMEIGFSSLPTKGYTTVMRAPRDRPLRVFPRRLRAADFGYHEQGTMSSFTTFDSTGNLECTPPATSKAGKRYPWGRIYFGPGRSGELMDASMKAFLEKQVVQAPIEIDTNFLAVGHVDEIISFVPASGSKGFKLLLSSPKRAYQLLHANKAAHGAEKLLIGRKFPEYDTTSGAIRRWISAKVNIRTFLDRGIPAMSLTAPALKAFNDAAQASIDATRAKFEAELGLDASDIIDVPGLFMPNPDLPSLADALTAGMVNMLLVNQHCVIPKPFGPVVNGIDIFEEEMRAKLNPLGLTLHFLDDWYEYHVQLGEVHCGTNTLRTTTSARWWEYIP